MAAKNGLFSVNVKSTVGFGAKVKKGMIIDSSESRTNFTEHITAELDKLSLDNLKVRWQAEELVPIGNQMTFCAVHGPQLNARSTICHVTVTVEASWPRKSTDKANATVEAKEEIESIHKAVAVKDEKEVLDVSNDDAESTASSWVEPDDY